MGSFHIPLDGLHADGADGGDDVVVVLPIGAADEGGPHAGDGLDLVVAGLHVGNDLLGGEAVVVGVGVGVVHHLVARVVEGLHRLRVFVHPVSDDKEGRLHLVLVQNVDELLGVLVAPGGVKADGYQVVAPVHTVDRQLSGGGRGDDRRRRVDHREDRQDEHHSQQRHQVPPAKKKDPHIPIPPILFCYTLCLPGRIYALFRE